MRRETEEHRSAQAKVAAILERKWECIANDLSANYSSVDYALSRKSKPTKVLALAEVKCRNLMVGTWPKYETGLAKLLKVLEMAETARVPFLFVVQFTDALGYVKITRPLFRKCRGHYHVGGRTDRGSGDMEMMVRIPIADFIFLEGAK